MNPACDGRAELVKILTDVAVAIGTIFLAVKTSVLASATNKATVQAAADSAKRYEFERKGALRRIISDLSAVETALIAADLRANDVYVIDFGEFSKRVFDLYFCVGEIEYSKQLTDSEYRAIFMLRQFSSVYEEVPGEKLKYFTYGAAIPDSPDRRKEYYSVCADIAGRVEAALGCFCIGGDNSSAGAMKRKFDQYREGIRL